MAKRSAKPSIPTKPGRFIAGYEDDSTSFEEVQIALDDSMLRRVADELKQVKATLDEGKKKMDDIKAELRDPQRRYTDLLAAISTGALTEGRNVWKFADDDAATVSLYDQSTYELLQTRPIAYWERQQDLDLHTDEDEDDVEDDE
jgi:septal ring factor EnvC (AmiA/AmiB activator)